MARIKNTHPNVRTVRDSKEFMEAAEQLRKEGFDPYNGMCLPSVSRNTDGSPQTWSEFIGAEVRCGSFSDSSYSRQSIPTLYFSSGIENKAEVEDIGTSELGFIEWGSNNCLPNVVSLLTHMLPYTAAGIKFNTDMLAGLGPQPMYDITQYVGGNITTKTIRYKDAGRYLRGQRADKLRELLKVQSEYADLKNEEKSDVLDGIVYGAESEDSAKKDCERLIEHIRKEIEFLDEDLAIWVKTNAELKEFVGRNNLAHTWLALCLDQMMFGLCLPELTLNQHELGEDGKPVSSSAWKPKVVGLSYRPCHTTRFERMDKNGVVNYVYCSNRWFDQTYVDQSGDFNSPICALPALNPASPLTSLEAKVREARSKNVAVSKRPTRFVCPSVYPTVGRPYYPTPAWHSIFCGDIYEYLSTIISDRFNRKKNSNIIGRVIYLNHEYLKSLSIQQDAEGNTKSIEQIREEFYQSVNTWLSNRENAGQSLLAFTFQGSDGKEHKSFEVVEIAAADKSSADANEKETAEIASIVFMALGLDARLLGSSPMSLVGTNSGTDIRERFLLRQILMSPTQNIMLKALDVASRFNGWDSHLVWDIKREVMTTLDRSKSGVTEAEVN